MLPVNVHAIERGRAPSKLPRNNAILETAFLDVVVLPTQPLHVGLLVHVTALEEIPDPSAASGRASIARPWYAARPADIAGRIVGIRTMELAVTEFIVLNTVEQSLVKHAYLTIEHKHGVTVSLGMWSWIVRTSLLPLLPHTRHVPIERNAAIVAADEDEGVSADEDEL